MRTATPTCPVCGRPSAPGANRPGGRSLAPFCSTRCADVDLGRWFTGQYRIPERTPAEGEDEARADGSGKVDPSGVPG